MGYRKPLSKILNGVTRFGRLTVLGDAPPMVAASGFAARCALVRCDCGVEKAVRACGLVRGDTNSCGCLQRELLSVAAKSRVKHGESTSCAATTEYMTWNGINQRCHNPNQHGYHRYGGRGIFVCDRWRGESGYSNFLSDMGRRPDGHSIERDDVNGPYSPDNCRWATAKEQCNNRRNNVILEIDGQSQTVAQWAEASGTYDMRIYSRLRKGWPAQEAVFGAPNGRFIKNPPNTRMVEFRGEMMPIGNVAILTGLTRSDLRYHMSSGRSVDEAVDHILAKRAKWAEKRKSA